MDINKKCQLITLNTLIHSAGNGYDYELNIEIYTELKNEIIKKLESIINPIIEEYKKYEKHLFCKKYGVDMDYKIEENLDLLAKSIQSHAEINKYVTVLKMVEERIDESRKKFDELKNTTTTVAK
ncbi:hypothetical protein DCCM_0459 [Desulfocucumis palustris]|uniref:Uncharacterized protein n=1 Tax=Desulfocucumis palustris TaxID=1898651 RepID=A0A2L2XDF9_9FIRM|nr:hypothetical protein [Desulfocucumis palustris]GBF32266.1 hypothetical protein DCCM_0459 [Desulfocucumis palustris]